MQKRSRLCARISAVLLALLFLICSLEWIHAWHVPHRYCLEHGLTVHDEPLSSVISQSVIIPFLSKNKTQQEPTFLLSKPEFDKIRHNHEHCLILSLKQTVSVLKKTVQKNCNVLYLIPILNFTLYKFSLNICISIYLVAPKHSPPLNIV